MTRKTYCLKGMKEYRSTHIVLLSRDSKYITYCYPNEYREKYMPVEEFLRDYEEL